MQTGILDWLNLGGSEKQITVIEKLNPKHSTGAE